MKTFTELTLQPSLHHNLKRNNFVEPTPVQAQSIPPGLAGADIVATAQTGTGKTLGFLIPIIEKLLAILEADSGHKKQPIRSLILAPTRELALQIADSFAKVSAGTNLRCAVVVGGLSEQTQLHALRNSAQVVIATPGRLEDFLNRRLIDLRMVSMLVLDEADRMLDMGFLPAIEQILATLPKNRQSLFFSATMNRTVEGLINGYSRIPSALRSMVLTAKPRNRSTTMFTRSAATSASTAPPHAPPGCRLVPRLCKNEARYRSAGQKSIRYRRPRSAMHGGRSQNQRNQALAGFRDGRYRVLVATDVVARGIHVDGVAHVVNFDLPAAPHDFIHRVGRTGRAGQRGAASTFISRSERADIRKIERACKVNLELRNVAPAILVELAEQQAQAKANVPAFKAKSSAIIETRAASTHSENKPKFQHKKSFGAGKGGFRTSGRSKSN